MKEWSPDRLESGWLAHTQTRLAGLYVGRDRAASLVEPGRDLSMLLDETYERNGDPDGPGSSVRPTVSWVRQPAGAASERAAMRQRKKLP
jgi:hypothetical protein